MKEKKMRPGVLLPVLIQDPAVAGETEARSVVHPVIVKDPAGFTEGPTCRRVAVVDLDFNSGKLRRPATFHPRPTPKEGVTGYETAIPMPTKGGQATTAWMREYGIHHYKRMGVDELGSLPLDDPFMKVSVFGTVLRTLCLIQDAGVLGREIPWGFRGEQLLIVPRAAEMDNAFYHRDSRSLQFYYGSSSHGRTVYSGLSQDIVAHETAHAIIDGIAPDLYDAISLESLAIHEGLADLTAAMLSMRNRERTHQPGKPVKTEEFRQSSRFSRIAEEFGRWRGHGDALRDTFNTKTLDANAAPDCRIDSSSPHSTSEVLSGLLFAVFCELYESPPNEPALQRKLNLKRFEFEGMRRRIAYAVNRTLGLAYRGLDWLPPGDASFDDFVAAMLAADREFYPDDPSVRKLLSTEAASRGITVAKAVGFLRKVKLPLNADARRAFVERHRKSLRVPAGARVKVTLRKIHIYPPPPLPRMQGERYDLKPRMSSRLISTDTEHYLIKLAWWVREANNIEGWGKHRCYRSGASIIVERGGRVRAVLRNRLAAKATASRSDFLRLMLAGESRRPQIGPDGVALRRGLRTSLKNGTLSIRGAMQALHVAGGSE